MILIICTDRENGLSFYGRRQSTDRVVRARILERAKGSRLLMNGYSYRQFKEDGITCYETFLQQAGPGDYCFAETELPEEDKIEKIILYRWDRKYPADKYFDIDLNNWKLEESTQFDGYSHKNITEEVYVK